jgi:HK97 family phage prohead protease
MRAPFALKSTTAETSMTDRTIRPPETAGQVRLCALDVKSVALDGVFEGYASLFNRTDLGRDVVLPGAFRDTLRMRRPEDVKMLFQHDPAQPIGGWIKIQEDARGLFVRGRLMREVARAREVLAMMREGAVDGLSIGFRMVKGARDRFGVRRLEKIDLWEISVVTFPMLPEARVSAVKADPFARCAPSMRDFERWLTQDAGFSRTEARAVMRQGFKGLETLRDAGRAGGWETRLIGQLAEATRLFNSETKSSRMSK